MPAKKLSELQKFYIDGHPEMSVSQLSKLVGVGEKALKDYLDTKFKDRGNLETEKKTPTLQPISLQQYGFSRRTDGSEQAGAVMTEGASESIDEFKTHVTRDPSYTCKADPTR